MTNRMTLKPRITSVDPWGRQPSFTAVPEALTISILSPTVS
jgi:hypothetical protein